MAGWGDTVPCRVLRALCQMFHVLRPAQCAPPHTCNKRSRDGNRGGKGQGGEGKEGEGRGGKEMEAEERGGTGREGQQSL